MRSSIIAVIHLLIAGTAVLASSAAGAATEPDETWTLPFEPTILGYDATADVLLVEGFASDQRTLVGVDANGTVAWSYVYAADASEGLHGIVVASGRTYVSHGPNTGDSTIAAIATASGTIDDQWTLDGNARRLQATADALWFSYAEYDGSRWTDTTIGRLDLATGAVDAAVISDPDHDADLAAVADDESFVVGLSTNQIARWDMSGASPVETHRVSGTEFALSRDDSRGFAADGDRLQIFDPATLAVTATIQDVSGDFDAVHELADGRLVGVRRASRSEPLITLVDTAPYHEILGRGLSDRGSESTTVAVVGDRIAYAEASSRSIRLHRAAPALDLSHLDPIEAGQAIQITVPGDFLASVDSVTLNGQNVLSVTVPAGQAQNQSFRSAAITIEAASLPAGSHTIRVDGPLGPSTATLEIEQGPDRSRLDVTLRPDSTGSSVVVWVHCHHPDASSVSADVSAQNVELARGETVSIDPIPGHRCHVSSQRNDIEIPGEEYHLSMGFYDPSIDRTGQSAIDLEPHTTEFTMPTNAVGVSIFAPGRDQQALWTYNYGVGTPAAAERSVTIDCPGTAQDAHYRTYYGNWQRFIVPRNEACLVTHPTPAGALASGFGFYEPATGGFTPPRQPRESTYYGTLQASVLVIIYDIYPHPSEHNGAFVRQQYLDFLGRQGDPGGLANWENALNSGTRSRTDLVQLFLDSPEFGGTVAPVNRLYQAYFDRAPDRGGLYFWVDWIRSGRSLGQVSDEFARSAEFDRTYGSLNDEDFIDLVYQNVLGRLPDAGGRAFWVDQMRGGLTRGQLMVNFSESAEFVEQTRAAVLVDSLYQGLLQRSPDPQGFAFWTGQVEAGQPIDALIAGMLSSDEYDNRFDDIYEPLPSGAARSTHLRVD